MLVVISLLATSSSQTAISELLIARNHKTHELAFQAAESGLEKILAAASFDTAAPVSRTEMIDARTSVHMQVRFLEQTSVPEEDSGLAPESGFAAYHFVGTATATVQRDAGADSIYDVSAAHIQSFYVVGPTAAVSPLPVVEPPVRNAWHVEGIE